MFERLSRIFGSIWDASLGKYVRPKAPVTIDQGGNKRTYSEYVSHDGTVHRTGLPGEDRFGEPRGARKNKYKKMAEDSCFNEDELYALYEVKAFDDNAMNRRDPWAEYLASRGR